jgi:hypothetical protein
LAFDCELYSGFYYDSACLNNGVDARQLWVKINGKVAFVVAFGDRPIEVGAKALTRLIVATIK